MRVSTVAAAAVVAVVLSGGALGDQCSAIEEDIDYMGNDLRTTRQPRAEDCCEDCTRTAPCVMFVWSNGTCWLKQSTFGVRIRVLGNRAGFLHRSTQCGVIMENTDFAGFDIDTTVQARAEACCDTCTNMNGCAAWVWYNDSTWNTNGVAGSGTCYFKSGGVLASNVTRNATSSNLTVLFNNSITFKPTTFSSLGRRAAFNLGYMPTAAPSTFPPMTSVNDTGIVATVGVVVGVTLVLISVFFCCYRIRKNARRNSRDARNMTTDTPGPLQPEYRFLGQRRQDIDDKDERLWRCNICAFDNSSDKDGCSLCETSRGTAFESPDQLNALQHSAWARHAWSRALDKDDGRPTWRHRPSHACAHDEAFYVLAVAAQPDLQSPDWLLESSSDSEPTAPPLPDSMTWQPLTRESAAVTVTGSVLPPTWFEDPDAPVVPFQEKYSTLLIHLTHTVTDKVKFKVRRDCIWAESLQILLGVRRASLATKTKVAFVGEDGIDAGGVQREWYSLMAQAFLDRGLFVAHANRTLGLNPVYPDTTHFLALGRFLARAIIDGQVLPLPLTVPLFKALVGAPLSIHDVRYVDETTYRSLVYVRDSDCVDALDLDFTWTLADGRSVELVPGGGDIPVTGANQAEYVACLVRYWLLESVRAPLELVVRGFYDVLQPDVMIRFDYKELELVVCGTSEINVVEWQFETEATPDLAASPALAWFWDVVGRDMRPTDHAKLLQFATGSSRVPLQGFKALTANDGQLCPFNLKGVPYTKDALPKVHTCFNRIVLPLYPSRRLMREALFVLVNMEVQDFTMK